MDFQKKYQKMLNNCSFLLNYKAFFLLFGLKET